MSLIGTAATAIEGAAAPYLIWIKLAAGVIAAAALGFAVHWVDANYYGLKIADMQTAQAQALVIAADRAMHAQEDADKITASLNASAAEARAQQLQQTIANLQKVHDYVSPQTDRAFPLPCGFLRLHDAAARGVADAAISLPAGKADGDQCDVAASAAASVIQSNYGLALGWKAERDSWWAWYEQQKTNWDAYRATAQKEN